MGPTVSADGREPEDLGIRQHLRHVSPRATCGAGFAEGRVELCDGFFSHTRCRPRSYAGIIAHGVILAPPRIQSNHVAHRPCPQAGAQRRVAPVRVSCTRPSSAATTATSRRDSRPSPDVLRPAAQSAILTNASMASTTGPGSGPTSVTSRESAPPARTTRLTSTCDVDDAVKRVPYVGSYASGPPRLLDTDPHDHSASSWADVTCGRGRMPGDGSFSRTPLLTFLSPEYLLG
jgi:hypothetical protein